jgi:hypothetical protein
LRQRTRIALALAVALVAGALVARPAAAERIKLRNGFDIKECWILEENSAEIVVAIIRNGNIGKITLDPTQVEQIDRTRETTLEEALSKARAAIEEEQKRIAEEKARQAAIAATATATPKDGAAGEKKPGEKKGEKTGKVSDLIPPTTPEEDAAIAEAIAGIGDTRKAGAEAGRRENALRKLVEFGVKAIPAITSALEDDVSYRRMNSARAIAEISAQEKRLEVYQEAIPKLIKLLYDPQPWVRVAADHALQAISGQDMSFPEPQGEELSPGETAAIDKWAKWWDEQKGLLTAKPG